MHQLRIAVALLANVLCWDAVTTDCKGRPEAGVTYAVVTASTLLVGWTAPTPDVPEPQPIYATGPGPALPAPVGTCVDMGGAPPAFGVYYYRPEPVDRAGNRPDQVPCP